MRLLSAAPNRLVAALAFVSYSFSQPAPPKPESAFEVASVRPTDSAPGEAYVQAVPGRLRMQNVAARVLIQLAYGVQSYQISGAPSWIASERFDIHAKAEGNPSVGEMEGPMLQALLADRFQLTVHHETRDLPAYEVRLVNGAAKLSPSTAGTCVPYRADAPPPPPPSPNTPRPFYCDYPRYSANGLHRAIEGKGITLSRLASALDRMEFHRPVLDRTNLPGGFDIHLEWTTDPPTGATTAETLEGPPSLVTALRDQLGLRLESTRAPADLIVIDRIEKPSGN